MKKALVLLLLLLLRSYTLTLSPASAFCNPSTGAGCGDCDNIPAQERCCPSASTEEGICASPLECDPYEHPAGETLGTCTDQPLASPTPDPSIYTGPCDSDGQPCCESQPDPINNPHVILRSCNDTTPPINLRLYCTNPALESATCATEVCGALNQDCCTRSISTGDPNCDPDLTCDYSSPTSGGTCVRGSCGNRDQLCCTTGDSCNTPYLTCERVPPVGGDLKCVYTGPACIPPTGQCHLLLCPGGTHSDPSRATACNLLEKCCVPNATPASSPSPTPIPPESPLCATATDPGVKTAIGCISLNPQDTITILLNWAVGLAGGISLILIIIASSQIITAQGEPKRVQAAQNLLTSALMGLVLIALSVVVLNFAGVNVLGLGSLGFHL